MRLGAFVKTNAPWLAAGGLLTFLSSFGQTFFISIFAAQVQGEFALSHGEWGSVYSLGTMVSAAVMVWAGGLTDHFRVRTLGTVILLFLSGACLLMAANPFVWALPIVIFALRLTGQGMTSHIAIVAMARWFVATRGRALSIATLGYAAGESILPLGFVALMTFVNWRLLWVLAAIIALAAIPAVLHLLREERTPQSMSQENQSAGMHGRHWTRSQTLRHPLFWYMVPAILGPSAFNTAFFFHQVHYAALKGWTHLTFVALFPIYTVLGIGAMLISGWALDRFGTPRLIPFYQLPMVLAFAVFSVGSSLWMAVIGLFFLALTSGANSTLPNAFWAEFYGTKNIGSIKAMAAAVMVLGSAIGPGVTGLLIDFGVGLERQYIGVAVYFLIASAIMFFGVRRARPSLAI
ncbi:MFS transporter [uncultured Roseobacter sp.]|uniref:MFS transporter n=1 Tax=uncultured Roseobacter sp. TaxID=114847 RepID=UPI00260C5341|nr:MFS transporter [uncultured Roseobacter sp.]